MEQGRNYCLIPPCANSCPSHSHPCANWNKEEIVLLAPIGTRKDLSSLRQLEQGRNCLPCANWNKEDIDLVAPRFKQFFCFVSTGTRKEFTYNFFLAPFDLFKQFF